MPPSIGPATAGTSPVKLARVCCRIRGRDPPIGWARRSIVLPSGQRTGKPPSVPLHIAGAILALSIGHVLWLRVESRAPLTRVCAVGVYILHPYDKSGTRIG